MDTGTFLNKVAAGEAAEAKDILNDLLSAKAFEALDAKKTEIAQALFNSNEEQVEPETETELEVQDTETEE